MTIAESLNQWQAYHLQYRDALRTNDTARMLDSLIAAHDARQAAHDADPLHADPAWSMKAVPYTGTETSHEDIHQSMMTFYDEVLARPESVKVAVAMKVKA